MNRGAASVVLASVVTVCATVAGVLGAIDGSVLGLVYTGVLAGGAGVAVGKSGS